MLITNVPFKNPFGAKFWRFFNPIELPPRILACSLLPFSILNVSAIVLANLCVSYIMTSQNEEAEELMRKIEKEEEQLAYEDPDRKVFHLCIVNLVIGKRNLIFLPPNK